ncbi:MAG: copper amine oxidase N-terminal domain-containing protein [Eubacterium sp.]|nr:copper amine oxidase N-terminal domain-containing protein [Eubacterium sp.]
MNYKLLSKNRIVSLLLTLSIAVSAVFANVISVSAWDDPYMAEAVDAALEYVHEKRDGICTIDDSRTYGAKDGNYYNVHIFFKDLYYGYIINVEKGTNKILSSLGNTDDEKEAIEAAVNAAYEKYGGEFEIVDNSAYIFEQNDSCYMIMLGLNDAMFVPVFIAQKGINEVIYSSGCQDCWVGMLDDTYMPKVTLKEVNNDDLSEVIYDSAFTIFVNGVKLSLEQEPIYTENNLLVPLYEIAGALGKTVKWSEKYKAAFIDNTDNALIIPVGETKFYIGDESAYSSWQTIETDVPAQIENGKTLVPLRQFCEALGAEVVFDYGEQAVYITYNNNAWGSMSNDLYDAVNLNYYIGRYEENPFKTYTDNIIEPFYESRIAVIDAVAMGISKPWEVINDLISKIHGDTNASGIIQQTMYDVISEIDYTSSEVMDSSIYSDIVAIEKADLKIFNEVNGIDEDFLEAHPDLKLLDDRIDKWSTGLDWFLFTTEELAYILSDYSVNIAYLDVFEKALAVDGEIDYNTQEAIDDLRDQYTNKFLETLTDLQDKIADEAVSAVLKLATGGIYSVGKTVWKSVFAATGVTTKGTALKTFYGIYTYNAELDRAFDTVMKNAADDADLSYIKAFFQIQKSTKKTAVNSIVETAHFWDIDERESAKQFVEEINNINYYVWDKPDDTSDGVSRGGGGSGGNR